MNKGKRFWLYVHFLFAIFIFVPWLLLLLFRISNGVSIKVYLPCRASASRHDEKVHVPFPSFAPQTMGLLSSPSALHVSNMRHHRIHGTYFQVSALLQATLQPEIRILARGFTYVRACYDSNKGKGARGTYIL